MGGVSESAVEATARALVAQVGHRSLIDAADYEAAARSALEAAYPAIRADIAAEVLALAEEWQSLHDRVCKETDESIPMSKRHAHNCGITGADAADQLRAALSTAKEASE